MNTPPDMSLWHLISHASLIVQLVMLVLISASIASWAIVFQRHQLYKSATQQADIFDESFWSGHDLNLLYNQVDKKPDLQGQESIFHAGFKEFIRLREKNMEGNAVIQGVTRAMRIALTQEKTRLETHLNFLASVGSTSPYIGLFGTVWGIMTSFIGLAKVQQATLSVVAPGIAEALIATAMGLFAAIPAVLAYNRFSSESDALLTRYETFADEFIGILHREVLAKH
jgi:biopolymer transport protein TolQ